MVRESPWGVEAYKLSAEFVHVVGFHIFSAAEYPFQDTRYCFCSRIPRCERILSISYSSSSPIRSGGGLEKFGPYSRVSL